MDEAIKLPVQMDTLTEILQERLLEMTNQIDRREQELIEKLRQTEDCSHKRERKTMLERQGHRMYIEKTMKRLQDWEENLLQREQMLERSTTLAQTQYERYTRKYEELQQQAERKITAWHEVAQTTMKEKLDVLTKQQAEKIEDFATNQEQQLVSLLDGYEEHARGIQAKLLARFHADLTQTHKEVQDVNRHKEAIPPDEEEDTTELILESP